MKPGSGWLLSPWQRGLSNLLSSTNNRDQACWYFIERRRGSCDLSWLVAPEPDAPVGSLTERMALHVLGQQRQHGVQSGLRSERHEDDYWRSDLLHRLHHHTCGLLFLHGAFLCALVVFEWPCGGLLQRKLLGQDLLQLQRALRVRRRTVSVGR